MDILAVSVKSVPITLGHLVLYFQSNFNVIKKKPNLFLVASVLIPLIHAGGSSRSGVKRPHDNSAKFPSDSSRHPSFSKVGYSSKHGPPQASTKTFKSMMRPGTKATKTASTKATDAVVVFLHCCVKPDRRDHFDQTIVQLIVYNYMKGRLVVDTDVLWCVRVWNCFLYPDVSRAM